MSIITPEVETRDLELAGRKITIRELTVSEVRSVLNEIEQSEESNLVDELLDGYIPAAAIAKSTGISLEELEKCGPSILGTLASEVGASNSFFENLIKRRVEAFNILKEQVSIQKEAS